MNPMQRDVEEFHRAMSQTVGYEDGPALRDAELRAALIEEEADETVKSIRAGDLVGALDGLCDLLYVVFGAGVAMGIDIDPFFAEVHRTNMLKSTGPVAPNGKRLKPEGWQPPRIADLLAALKRRHENRECRCVQCQTRELNQVAPVAASEGGAK